jgi:hypothetical protein
VRAGRKEEVTFMENRGIWKVVKESECWEKTGKAPTTVKWVDTMKEGGLVRCRLVARDFKGKGERDREDLFAATPPLEAKRILISRVVTRRKRRGRGVRKLMFIDARKAHLNPRCEKEVYIKLPEESRAEEGMCGKLVHWLYGFRPAAQAWEELYSKRLEEAGFTRGLASPVVFYHEDRDIAVVVHGDDFTFEGADKDLWWIHDLMKSWFEIKLRGVLGPEEKDDKEVTILGRVVSWKEWGVEYKADPNLRRKLLEQLGFNERTRILTGNGDKEEEDGDDDDLDEEEAKEYRKAAATLNYLGQDSPDLAFGTKEACRGMAVPKRGDYRKMKKVVRYLLGRQEVVWRYEWQEEGEKWKIFTDSDWGGASGPVSRQVEEL